MNKHNAGRTVYWLIIFLIVGIPCSSNILLASQSDQPPAAVEGSTGRSVDSQDKVYSFIFRGNSHFSERELLKAAAAELQTFAQRGYRKADIDDAAFQMRAHYRQAGFAFAAVDYSYEKHGDKISVAFQIDEGSRVYIESLTFTGNQQVSTETLKSFFPYLSETKEKKKAVFLESQVKDTVNRILNYYLGEGFIDAVVKSPELIFSDDRSLVAIDIHISEGPQYFIRDIQYQGDIIPELFSDLEKIREEFLKKPYHAKRKLLLQTRLAEVYDELGYAEAEFDIATAKQEESGSMVLQVRIKSGAKIRIADIYITGNISTRESFIRNRLEFSPGDIYTNAKRRDSFRKLYDSGLFSKISIELGPAEQDDRRNLVVTVEELPTREVYIEPGWGSYEELRLRVGVLEKSLFGTGRNGSIDGLVHTKGETVTLSYTDPWLLQTEITMNVPFFYQRREEPSYTSEETGISFQFSRKIGSNVSLTAGYQYKMTQLFGLNDDSLLPKSEEDYNKGTLGFNLVWDTRDDIFFPAKGLRLAGGFDISLPALGSDLEFSRLTLGCRYFLELPREYILGLRATTGLIIPMRDQVSLPVSERFFNGGDNTVRSYKYSRLGPKDSDNEPLGGHGYNVFSVELRKRLYRNLTATLFVDAGNVSPNSSLQEQNFMPYTSRSELLSDTLSDFFKEFKYGFGIGLQYLLPVGPVRFDIAYNPDPEEIWHEDSWVYHFSLGMAF